MLSTDWSSCLFDRRLFFHEELLFRSGLQLAVKR
jgi:hypothetical protein